MLSFTAVREQLDISQPVLTRLIRDGLPYTLNGRVKQFDEQAVARWLVDTGRATVDEPAERISSVAVTRAECGRHFGVSVRAVAEWLLEDDFPGRAGRPGRQNGYFPLDEIEAWLRDRDATRDGGPESAVLPSQLRSKLLAVKIRREERRDSIEAGDLAPLSITIELVGRTIHIAKRLLETIPDEAAKMLPSTMPSDTKIAIIQQWRRRVYEVEDAIAEAILGDVDDCSDPENPPQNER